MQDKIITIRRYQRIEEAQLDWALLNDKGIEAIVYDSTVVQVMPFLQDQTGGVELHVFDKDVEKALEILADYHQLDS